MSPPADDLDRGASGAPDDDDEYELEAPDPDVIAARERHDREVAAAAESKIDVDELYREDEDRRRAELSAELFAELPRRFQIKHMLWATAGLAIALTLVKLLGPCAGLFVIGLVGLVASLAALHTKERQQEAQLAERRRKFYERQRALRAQQGLEKRTEDDSEPISVSDVDLAWQEAVDKQRKIDFSFSLQQMMIAVTGAAIVFGMLSLMSPATLAVLLGSIAVAGLLLHALGFEPPPMVVLGWWLLLVMYVSLSIVTIVWQRLTG